VIVHLCQKRLAPLVEKHSQEEQKLGILRKSKNAE